MVVIDNYRNCSNVMSREVVKTENKTLQSSMRDVYYVLFRHKWKMILFFLAVTITVFVKIFKTPDIYRSEAKLFVRLGREYLTLDATVTTGQTINVSQNRDSEVNVELEILKSRELSEKVVDSIGPDAFNRRPARNISIKSCNQKVSEKALQQAFTEVKQSPSGSEQFNLAKTPGDRDKAVHKVMSNLSVKAEKDSSIISISYESESPELAKDVIDTLLFYYEEKHFKVHQTTGSDEFFLKQVSDSNDTLALLEKELQDFRDETGISSLEEQRQDILSHIADLVGQIGAEEANLAACRAKVQEFQKTVSNVPETLTTQETTGFSSQAVDLMRAKLYELQLQEHDLLSKFTEESEQVRMIHKKVAEAQTLFDKEKEMAKEGRIEVSSGRNPLYTQIQSALSIEQANLSSIQAKIVNLNEQLATEREKLKTINEADFKITKMRREIDMQQTKYQRNSDKLDQARIDHELDRSKISNISKVQTATLPTRPVPQRRTIKLALGFLVGILGGIGLAFFFEHMDNSIRTPAEVEEKLLLPALASIPRARVNRIHPDKKWIKQSRPGDKDVKNTQTKWRIPARISKHYSIFREELLLKLNGRSKAPHTLAIVGCQRGEGVSTVAANISAMLAQGRGGRVLLIDTNIRRPSAHQIFKTRLQPGLADIPTAGHDYRDIIVSQRFKNLHILAAGMPNGNPLGILQPTQFTQFINSMKTNYRHVIIDMPAIKEARFSARLSSLCDGVVLVIEAERLRWQVLLEAKEQLLKWNANLVGVVLNKRRFPIPGWLYRML